MTTSPALHGRRTASRAVATTLALGMILAACSSTDTGGGAADPSADAAPAELTVWTYGGIDTQVSDFNKANPDIKVTVQTIPSDGYYPKLLNAVKAGEAPDIALIEYQMLPNVQSAGGLTDLAKFGAADLESKYEKAVWNQVSRDGAVLGIPSDVSPMGLYYRKDILDQYGVAVPTTWEEYAAAAATIRAADPSKIMTYFPPTDGAWLTAMAAAGGSRWFGTEGDSWTVEMQDEHSKKFGTYWQQMITDGHVKVDAGWSDSWNADLASGALITWPAPPWGAGILADNAPQNAGKWAVAPLPTFAGEKAGSSMWGGSAYSVMKTSAHPEASLAFLTYLLTDSKSVDQVVITEKILPAPTASQTSDALLAPAPYYAGQVINEVFLAALPTVGADFMWGPGMQQFYTDLQDETGAALSSGGTVNDALAGAQKKTVAFMEQQGLSVSAK